ncbi:hypothetical protein F5ESL0233_04650 [Lactobacillus sp. ESL0233]|uniref:SLAP domain-containing protein n=1 Tax=Lactobacillus sp. ESL0233 TaxID=2069354 RepID=UPI000EFA350B|nr:SLAP domain-containing protein [Lactobacillus sp. ESL0233]RMC41615.1 hypothetical protein F5ESL0233_04650 [Lactobacillus sp. ESL0233]
MLKRKKLITLGAIIALGFGGLAKTSTDVNAASWKVKLTHNAYVYTYDGMRNGSTVLKKGHKYIAHGTKMIVGEKFIKLSKNHYIKLANTKKAKFKKINEDLGNQSQSSPSSDAEKSNKKEPSSKIDDDLSNYDEVSKGVYVEKTKLMTQSQMEEIKSSFLKYVNNWRNAQGKQSFTTINWLSDGAQLRANECIDLLNTNRDISHTRPNGQGYSTAFTNKNQIRSEVIVKDDYGNIINPDEIAEGLFNVFIYHDAASNWGHKKTLESDLLNPAIGIGVATTFVNKKPYVVLVGDTASLR